MNIITIEPHNAAHVKIIANQGIYRELNEFFSYYMPNWKYHPRVKAGIWDGKLRIFDARSRLLPVGLFEELKEFCNDNEYKLIDNAGVFIKEEVSEDIAEIVAKQINLNKKFILRGYQKQYVYEAIRNHRSISLSPTGSGKSLCICLIASYYVQKYQSRCLIIVPTVGLVKQMASDFLDYGIDPNQIHGISAGKTKHTDKTFTVGTWQSIVKMVTEDPKWFDQFEVILGDETHKFAAKSLQDIMNACTKSYWRHGFTGTIGSDSKVDKLVLEAVFGPINKFVTTKELIEDGTLAEFKIESIVLSYPKEVKKDFWTILGTKKKGSEKFALEREFLAQFHPRNDFIRKLVKANRDQNILVLFDLVEKHGDVLKQYIEKIPGIKVHYVHGGISGEERERIRQEVDTDDEAGHVIIASKATFATGTNIKRLSVCIFSSSSTSEIVILQSIGRTLRKGAGMDCAVMYDMSDDLKHGTKENYTLKHFKKRLQTYAKEGFKCKINSFDITI